MSNDLIYMDYSDYSDDPRVFETMSPYFTGCSGMPPAEPTNMDGRLKRL